MRRFTVYTRCGVALQLSGINEYQVAAQAREQGWTIVMVVAIV